MLGKIAGIRIVQGHMLAVKTGFFLHLRQLLQKRCFAYLPWAGYKQYWKHIGNAEDGFLGGAFDVGHGEGSFLNQYSSKLKYNFILDVI